MIDFRYHLVSIISVFMALAVGIVLGAGPLKGEISDTLTQEVTQLREDRTDLRAELEAVRKNAATRDDFTADARARLVGGTLTGSTVALVMLPSADADDVTAVTEALAAAGATVVSRTTVEDSWVPKDDDAAAAITTLATEQRRALGLPAASEGDATPLDDVLATTLVSASDPVPAPGAQPGAEPDAISDAGKAALDAIRNAGLIDVETADLRRASNAVLVGGVVKNDVVTERDRVANRLARLSASFDRAGKGAVLASHVGVAGFEGGASVVQVARDEAGIARNLSTVDHISVPLGQVSVVYALVQQNAGGVGQYGFGDGVSAGYPPIPAQ